MGYRIIEDIETVIELMELSMDDFASELGVSRTTINNWISEKHEISPQNAAFFYEYTFKKGIRLNKIKEQLYTEDVAHGTDVLLFHGAKTVIEGRLRLDYSKKNNDFGNGLYCGESLEQSAMFVSSFPQSSLYMLKFHPANLKSKEFHVDRDWMLMIAYFRNRLGEYANSNVIQDLLTELRDIDYIIAPIADNRMFEIIDQFIDGEITDVQCQHCLSATNLGKQYVFISEQALKQIEVLEQCYLANTEKEYYLTSKQESYDINRDKVKIARKQYRGQGKYIEDILQ